MEKKACIGEKRDIIPPLGIELTTTLPTTFDMTLTSVSTATSFVSRRKWRIWTRSARSIITQVFSFDETKTLAILMRTVTLGFGMAVLPAIGADPENGAVAKVVGTCLAPGTISVSEIGCGIDVTEMGVEFAIRDEEGHVIIMT